MIVDIINKKREGKELSYKELEKFFNGYLNGEIKDYQMSALLMAICIKGMTEEEVYALTKIFIDSGDILDFGEYLGTKVDKHSTGGIGDKTTLIIGPIVASCGVPVVKMSGRGLGYTGGTIDKLESIPGFRIDLDDEEVIKQVKDIGLVVTGQTKNLAPMDKVIYALRDVTGTVSSIPLIASSIMSKKIAGGADKILVDIKVGKGALLKSEDEAKDLSNLMIRIGNIYNREVRTKISNMNVPLGRCIGNSIEVQEAISILQNKEKDNNLYDLCIDLATEMVSMGKEISESEAKELVLNALNSGDAYAKFLEMVNYQHGDIDKIEVCEHKKYLKSYKKGILTDIDALEIGKLAVSLGAGRKNKEDKIDYSVGIKLNKLIGENVKKGEILAYIYTKDSIKDIDVKQFFTIQ